MYDIMLPPWYFVFQNSPMHGNIHYKNPTCPDLCRHMVPLGHNEFRYAYQVYNDISVCYDVHPIGISWVPPSQTPLVYLHITKKHNGQADSSDIINSTEQC